MDKIHRSPRIVRSAPVDAGQIASRPSAPEQLITGTVAHSLDVALNKLALEQPGRECASCVHAIRSRVVLRRLQSMSVASERSRQSGRHHLAPEHSPSVAPRSTALR
jgi:hypothetical protein